MRSPGGGYTIIEVLIFLAISSIIFFFAMIAVGGSQAHTEFSTAVDGVNTKFQQWIDQVNNGSSGSTASATASNFICSLDGSGYPVLTGVAGGNQRGSNPECVFLGKAIQVNEPGGSQDPRKIYVYSVLGRRVTSAVTGALADNLVNAKPVAAVFSSIPGGDLTETFMIPNGARVKWVKNGDGPTWAQLTGPNSGTSHMAGFYTSFNSGGTAAAQNGNQSLISVQYPLNDNQDARSGAVKDCIKMTSSGACSSFALPNENPWPLNQWVVCLESTRNSDTAAINIISTNGNGATTKVTTPCPES